jgi:N-acetylmuramoyl-L-alanine amidase
VPTPSAPVYPDISGFDRSSKSIVFTLGGTQLISTDGETTPIDSGVSLITVGKVDSYAVILRSGELYLAPAECITDQKPAAAMDKQAQLGGSFYPGNDKTVVIDPGHQGKGMSEKEPNAPGSDIMKAKVASGTQGVATGIEEYKLNLAVSLLLRDELIERGYTVVMIRESNDARISNAERAVMANDYGADAFIRVHANGSSNPDTKGAIAIFQTSSNPWCGDLYAQSRLLSETVLKHYCERSGIENDGNWETDTMTGINWTRVPATIIELGYMSNPDEDRLMATEEFHAAAAEGIVQGIDAFFDIAED